MPDFTHTDLQIVGRHVPDENSGPFADAQEAQAAGYDTLNPVTGTYEIGVIIEGAFVPLISEKASLVFDRIDVAKQQAANAPTQAAPAQDAPAPAPAMSPDAGQPAPDQPAPAPDTQPQG